MKGRKIYFGRKLKPTTDKNFTKNRKCILRVKSVLNLRVPMTRRRIASEPIIFNCVLIVKYFVNQALIK